ncbi:hypothetical protein [Nonomuraea basaltis]|uniref:hypothetical protein n=1 Tax=Nonomuraea basaltis TaxID=2495887 RepID=UPI00110C3F06|nr:hypothetical protein [Nonomuraea basaltis]TMR97311.1 hypothetical protein EJK15_18745 [Nonomuraea basaltis]
MAVAMAVMLATMRFAVQRAIVTVDAHGTRSASNWTPAGMARPGRIVEEPVEDGERDGPGMWVLGVDPADWPLRARDLVVEPSTGREWVVITVKRRAHAVEASVDWLRVEATLRQA